MNQRILAPLAVAILLALPGNAPAEAPGDVVATIGDQTITYGDLEKAVKSQLMELDDQRYEILEGGLNNLISERLLTMDAAEKGKTLEQYQQELLSAPVEEPPADQIQKIYDENKNQPGIDGKPLDEVKGRIVEFLKKQQRVQKVQTLLADLRKKHNATVKLQAPVVAVTDGGREAKGGASAPVTIIGFSDYECPYCKQAEPTVAEVIKIYGDKVRYVHRDFPLPFHKFARKAAETARCAGEQGKFWETHDAMFTAELSDESIDAAVTTLGLDKAKIDACMTAGTAKKMVDEDMEAGEQVGVSGTPTFYVNGRKLMGPTVDGFKQLIDSELAKKS
jgi:protein-disulfide isomerase